MTAVFLPSWPDNPYQELLAAALATRGVDVVPLSRRLWFAPAVLRAGARVLHLHSPDHMVVYARHAGTAWLRLAIVVSQLALLRLLGVGIFWTVHELVNHEGRNRLQNRLCLAAVARLAHGLFVHCACAKRELLRSFPRAGERPLEIVPHGSYLGRYPPAPDRALARRTLGVEPGAVLFLMVGNLRRYKSVADLIAAFAPLDRDTGHLLIAGQPWDDAIAAEITRGVADQANVRFAPGFVADQELVTLMAAADVLVFPFRAVLTSGSVVLAMSFGKACVAPRLGCIAEALEGAGAFLYDAEREGALAEALALALARRAELEGMGRQNLERVRAWRWEDVAEVTATAYRRASAAA